MADGMLLAGILLCCVIGCAWLALAMDPHWQQVVGSKSPSKRTRVRLRICGALALLVALKLALAADHASIASLVWIMAVATAALIVAFTLAWRPKVLRLAAPWFSTSPT